MDALLAASACCQTETALTNHRLSTGRRILLAAAASLFALGIGHGALREVAPEPHDWVTDSANVLASSDRRKLSDMLRDYHRDTHHQIAVLTVATIGAEAIEAFSLRTARMAGLGYKGLDNGILVVLAMKEHRMRIELGTGMQRYVSDADAQSIIEEEMRPAFSKGDYAGGLERGLRRLMAKARRFVVKASDLPPGAN